MNPVGIRARNVGVSVTISGRVIMNSPYIRSRSTTPTISGSKTLTISANHVQAQNVTVTISKLNRITPSAVRINIIGVAPANIVKGAISKSMAPAFVQIVIPVIYLQLGAGWGLDIKNIKVFTSGNVGAVKISTTGNVKSLDVAGTAHIENEEAK